MPIDEMRPAGAGRWAAVCLTAVAAGCHASAPVDSTGPLSPPDERSRLVTCARFQGDGVLAVGNDVVDNRSDEALTADSLDFEHSSGVTVIGAKLVIESDPDAAAVGLMRGWPTTGYAAEEADLMRSLAREPDVVGSTIPPHSGPVTLTVGLRTRPDASASRLTMRYHDPSGHRYVWVGSSTIRSGNPRC